MTACFMLVKRELGLNTKTVDFTLMWTSHILDYKNIFLQTKVCAYWARKSVLSY